MLHFARYTDKRRIKREDVIPEPGRVLGRLVEFVQRYVSMTDAQATVFALWVVHTHISHLAQCTPYLAVTSKTKRSGKTRLLEVSELLVHEPLRTANITEAALFRALSTTTRTLLLDEVDTVFGEGKSRELLRAILNASYRRGSPVYRTRGKDVEGYDVFSPKMIAGIGDLPDTVSDRSIPIRLQRATPANRFRLAEVSGEAELLKDLIRTLYQDEFVLRSIYRARPELPDFLHDRQQDSWEPLLQIAEASGWLQQAYQAAEDIHVGKTVEPWRKEGHG